MSGYANFQTKLHYALNGDPQAQREFIANELIFHRPLCAVPSILNAKNANQIVIDLVAKAKKVL